MTELKNEFSWSKSRDEVLKPVSGNTGLPITATGTEDSHEVFAGSFIYLLRFPIASRNRLLALSVISGP
jgi:hypothetical protein